MDENLSDFSCWPKMELYIHILIPYFKIELIFVHELTFRSRWRFCRHFHRLFWMDEIPSITQNKVVRVKNKVSARQCKPVHSLSLFLCTPSPFFVHPCICPPMDCMRWLEREVTLFQVGWFYSVLLVVPLQVFQFTIIFSAVSRAGPHFFTASLLALLHFKIKYLCSYLWDNKGGAWVISLWRRPVCRLIYGPGRCPRSSPTGKG